ncbi:MAG: hypothetical protein G3M78_04835 [Candidatus Nitrohelix vancouverensis]|uniref:Uncharacterized protein n=1 Tax=Candidatus Nitrohelix vancouverensis TaxID=2705534 RepID=A0A7T0C1D9_9BACT|nr:MAG: hypothetical protein G3M78_04835 [Candidatus Nitrohelix vancouverensis]
MGGFGKFIFYSFLASIAGGYFAWKTYAPAVKAEWNELKDKHPEKHAKMAEELKSGNLQNAKTLYHEIDAMTYEEVLNLRYKKFDKKRRTNKEFRMKEWGKELELRATTRDERASVHETKLQELKALNESDDPTTAQVVWKGMSSLEKGAALRSNCAKYLDLERREQLRRKSLGLPATAPLLNLPNRPEISSATYCSHLISDTLNPQQVEAVILALKSKLNYFYFVEMLREIGIDPKAVFSDTQQLNSMAGDYVDS